MSKVARLFQSSSIAKTLSTHNSSLRLATQFHASMSTTRQVTKDAASMEKDWSSKQYVKFLAERTRPSRDLLERVALDSPKRIVDVGCGPANSTAVIRERYPNSNLSGMDSSPDMIKKAKETLPDLSFEVADLETYEPEGPVDLFFSNAVFQWVPGSRRIQVLTRLIERLAPGGTLAFQVPVNLSEPSHVSMSDVAFAPDAPWREKLIAAAPARDNFQSPVEIYDAFKPLCSEVDAWETKYFHVMENHQAIVEWVKGTGLRPFLDPLTTEEQEEYLKRYLALLKERYPAQKDGKVLLPFPRLFVVATKA